MINRISSIIALVIVVATLVPLSPHMPTHGLDPSWVMGLSEAVGKGLAFGREVIFTYGPYASVFTKTYHPATDSLMVYGSLYLALVLWACLAYLVAETKISWMSTISILLVIVGIGIKQDVLLFSIPLVIGICVHTIVFGKRIDLKSGRARVFVIVICSCLGLLPLIKGSFFLYSFAVLMASVALFISSRKFSLGLLAIFSSVLSLNIFWSLSGQSLVDLPGYFISMLPIMSGYSESMAMSGGPMEEIYIYLLASAVLLISIVTACDLSLKSKIFLSFIFGGYAFVSFKAGFVRHDAHALVSGGAMLVAALLFPLAIKSKFMLYVIFSGVIVWLNIDSHFSDISTSRLLNNIYQPIIKFSDGLRNRLTSDDHLVIRYSSNMKQLRSETNLPILKGTTDIYPTDISELIASGNAWNPRPVFQSYSAYDPYLADANMRHLTGDSAPDNIIFKVSPIDWRMPSIEDGASWPALLANYRPMEFRHGFLILERLGQVHADAKFINRSVGQHALGEIVDLPKTNSLVFAQIHIRPTFFGRLAKFFYKIPGLLISITLENGTEKKFRIPSGLVNSNFLLSPLVENITEFGMLFGEAGYLDLKNVRAISVTPESTDMDIKFWKESYSLVLQQMEELPKYNIQVLFDFDEFREMFGGAGFKQRTLDKCFGNIDIVNGISPAPSSVKVNKLLTVDGWLIDSLEDASLPDAVYLVLTDSFGKRQYLRANSDKRPDVGNYFGVRKFDESGFRAVADVSTLEGERYKLSLAMLVSGEMLNCPEFQIPITIGE